MKALRQYSLIPLLLLLAACVNNPLKVAEGDEEKAYAALGIYHIVQLQVLNLVQDQTIPADYRKRIAAAENAALPVIKALDDALLSYLEVKDALAAGTTTDEKVRIAAANLASWTLKAQTSVREISLALKGA